MSRIGDYYLAQLAKTGQPQTVIAAYLSVSQASVSKWFRRESDIPSKYWEEIEQWAQRITNAKN